jgi:galactitol-specific phosphotransferase system IIC component
LGFYGLAVLAQAIVLAARGNMLRAIAAVPLIVMSHILYGWGFWRGLFTKLQPPEKRPPAEVVLETLSR